MQSPCSPLQDLRRQSSPHERPIVQRSREPVLADETCLSLSLASQRIRAARVSMKNEIQPTNPKQYIFMYL